MKKLAMMTAVMIAMTTAVMPEAEAKKVVAPGDMPDALGAVVATQEVFYAGVQRSIDEYLAWRYEQDVAAWAAAHAPPRTSSRAVNVGDCGLVAEVVGTGTVSHESGGNPLAENGIYKGCAQIGMPWWNGACSGLDWTSVADQAACARIVMNLQGPSAWAGTYSP